MNEILERLKTPGLGLIITGGLNLAIGFLTVVSGLLRLTGVINEGSIPSDQAGRIGYFIGTAVPYMMAFLSLICAPIILFGATRMMNGRSGGWAKTAAILAILPVTSCCFPAGAIFGIMALVVMSKPDVKAYFAGVTGFTNPPSPPRF